MPNTTDEAESHGRVEELVIDNKLSKKSKAVTCSKCHKQGHNARTCKGWHAIYDMLLVGLKRKELILVEVEIKISEYDLLKFGYIKKHLF